MHRIRLLLGAAVLALAASSCGGDDATTLILRAQSEAGEFEVAYRVGDDAPIVERVSSPWEATIDVSGAFSVDLTATNLNDSGLVGCEIDIAGSAAPPPRATGEAAADCALSGTATGGDLSSSSSAFGTPFDDTGTEVDDPATEDDDPGTAVDDPADEPVPEGVSVDVVFADRNGRAVDPAQFDEVRLIVMVEGLSDFDDLQVAIDATVDNGDTIGSYDQRTRFDQDDVDASGRLVDTVTAVRFDEIGSFPTTAVGSVLVDGARLPFEVELIVDIEPVEVTIETSSFSDGFITVDLPSSWSVDTDAAVGATTFGGAEMPPFDLEQLEQLFVAKRADSQDVAVFRVARPLTTSVDAVADVLEQAIAESGTVDRSTGTIDGRESIRLTFTGDTSGTGDVLAIADEIIYIQARAADGSDEAASVRDSIELDPLALPALSHARSIVFDGPINDSSGADPLTLVVETAVPGDWVLLDDLGAAVGDPDDGELMVFVLTPPEAVVDADALLDTAALDWTGTASDAVEIELNGRTFSRIDIASGSDAPVAIVATVLPLVETQIGVTVSTQVVRSDGRAAELLDQILASLDVQIVSAGG